MFYVSVVDGPRIGDRIEVKRMGLLAGPFERHDEALGKVDVVRRIADARATLRRIAPPT